MGGGRRAAVAGIAAALTVAAFGCGAQERTNDPRPQVATRVSVKVGPSAISVQPPAIALGPEKSQQIPQNQNHAQPPIRTDRPVSIVFTVANETDHDTQLQIHGPKDASSGPMVANAPGSFQTKLPTGVYTSAAGPAAILPASSSASTARRPRTTCFCRSAAPRALS